MAAASSLACHPEFVQALRELGLAKSGSLTGAHSVKGGRLVPADHTIRRLAEAPATDLVMPPGAKGREDLARAGGAVARR